MSALSVDLICEAVEQILTDQLSAALAAQGAMREAPTALDLVLHWHQLPSRQALHTAELPAGAITSPGLVGVPIRDELGHYRATWSVAVAVYARGVDHNDTTQRMRAYAAAVRDVLIANPSLGGVAIGVRWTHEEYALLDPRASRTEGGCMVEIEVDVQDAAQPTTAGTPIVEATGDYQLIHPAL
jgi:hypothetical protein